MILENIHLCGKWIKNNLENKDKDAEAAEKVKLSNNL
jgi:hypothetical protein